ncbi:hypothetical protein B0H17DRAFT_208415 [Mycena rosella]|uniref:Uncharacterized protein n=1 Tax=Mycena rosella TaxID=1033263 RepID=A0AAD7G5U0_MYCRO|nr:hypothetical protein B0H17DRAFT_208415 [Mycena rosella]
MDTFDDGLGSEHNQRFASCCNDSRGWIRWTPPHKCFMSAAQSTVLHTYTPSREIVEHGARCKTSVDERVRPSVATRCSHPTAQPRAPEYPFQAWLLALLTFELRPSSRSSLFAASDAPGMYMSVPTRRFDTVAYEAGVSCPRTRALAAVPVTYAAIPAPAVPDSSASRRTPTSVKSRTGQQACATPVPRLGRCARAPESSPLLHSPRFARRVAPDVKCGGGCGSRPRAKCRARTAFPPRRPRSAKACARRARLRAKCAGCVQFAPALEYRACTVPAPPQSLGVLRSARAGPFAPRARGYRPRRARRACATPTRAGRRVRVRCENGLRRWNTAHPPLRSAFAEGVDLRVRRTWWLDGSGATTCVQETQAVMIDRRCGLRGFLTRGVRDRRARCRAGRRDDADAHASAPMAGLGALLRSLAFAFHSSHDGHLVPLLPSRLAPSASRLPLLQPIRLPARTRPRIRGGAPNNRDLIHGRKNRALDSGESALCRACPPSIGAPPVLPSRPPDACSPSGAGTRASVTSAARPPRPACARAPERPPRARRTVPPRPRPCTPSAPASRGARSGTAPRALFARAVSSDGHESPRACRGRRQGVGWRGCTYIYIYSARGSGVDIRDPRVERDGAARAFCARRVGRRA